MNVAFEQLVGGLGGWLIWLKIFCSSGHSPQANAG
jgi:hypothetical protein